MMFQWLFNLFSKNKINSRHLPIGTGIKAVGYHGADDAKTIIASTNVKIFMRLDDGIELTQGNDTDQKMKNPDM